MAQSISGEKAERALKHAGAWIAKHKSGLNEVVKAAEAAGLPFIGLGSTSKLILCPSTNPRRCDFSSSCK